MTFQARVKPAAGLALLAAVLVLGWLTRTAQVGHPR
jgi:hypothetical protein